MSNAGMWAGIVILLYAGTFFYQSLSLEYYTRMGPGPGFFPRWLGGLLFVLTLCYIWEAVKHKAVSLRDLLPEGRALGNMGAMLGGLIVFTLILRYTGFVTAGAVLMFAMFIRDFRWPYALGAAVGVSVLLFVVFQGLLGVSLPTNDFGW